MAGVSLGIGYLQFFLGNPHQVRPQARFGALDGVENGLGHQTGHGLRGPQGTRPG